MAHPEAAAPAPPGRAAKPAAPAAPGRAAKPAAPGRAAKAAAPAAELPAAAAPRLDLTAVVPCYNEGGNVDRAYAEITAELDRYGELALLFVDDGSTDDTLARIKALAAADPRVGYLAFSRNFGQEAAFSAGFRYARTTWVVQFDADLQFPPAAVHALIGPALAGQDAVFGVREARRDPLLRRAGSAAAQWVAARWLGIELPRGASTFRVVRTAVARRVVDLNLAVPYFLATVPLLTSRWTTVPVPHRPRQGGRSKWSLRRLGGHALDLWTGFSVRPLALTYLLAAGSLLLAGTLAVLALAGSVSLGVLAAAALAVGVAALVGLAILARYLVRVLRGQPRPPFYLIRESNLPVRPEDDLYALAGVPAAMDQQ
jgi:polyisoprenyl-phosphate glycosyltransferase